MSKTLPFKIWNGNPSGDRLIIHVQQRDINGHLHLIPPIITSVQTISLLSAGALGTGSSTVYGPYEHLPPPPPRGIIHPHGPLWNWVDEALYWRFFPPSHAGTGQHPKSLH